MNNELLLVLDYIEREKGISKDVVISAIEAALLSAARKKYGEDADLEVKIDISTGNIQVFHCQKGVKSADFGRIAAQTAKQIITQKIREAEREIVFTDFNGKIGDITNGIVHRFEKGNIIIDLGKTEGVLSRKEILPSEEFRQGERIRAMILDVRKTTRGPQIILSRTNAGFVKRLFELEVPEIYEGIVEIKSISRQAGERTKVAVWSNDDKIDSVGACVGVRGSRIKNIVRELHGEKVDIIRWNENIIEFVKAALSPAKITSVEIFEDEKRIDLDVDEENLSLAIGKKGQNVRLASKLVNWTINIKNREQPQGERPKTKLDELLTKEDVFEQLTCIGDKTKKALLDEGFSSLESVANATVEDLTKVKGLGEKRARQIIEQAKELI